MVSSIPDWLPQEKKGGLNVDQIEAMLNTVHENYPKWGFPADELQGPALFAALFEHNKIEWNRISAFQDVTMRLIAQRLLEISVSLSSTPRPAEYRYFPWDAAAAFRSCGHHLAAANLPQPGREQHEAESTGLSPGK